MEIINALEQLNLSKSEAEVYLATLKIGLAKASEVAKKANVKREAVYYILQSLHERGFISEFIKSGVKYYSAASPKRLLGMIDEEKQRKSDTIKEIMPELESLQKIALEHPKIEVYEGFEGIKTGAAKILEKENQVVCCYISEKILHYIPYFHPQFRRKRKERNIKLRVLASKSSFFIKNLKKKDKEELRETRFIEGIMDDADICIYILSDALLILKANEKEQLGIYIKEPLTARLQKAIFERMWKQSKS